MKSKTIILSIHPCHIEKIFSGEKLYEYRKIVPSDIQNIVVYATSPIKKIVAIIEVDKVLTDTPESIWKQTSKHSGVTKEFFMSYFREKEKANAIKIKRFFKLKEPKLLSFVGIKYAPQSFTYIHDSYNVIKKKSLVV
ncbi:MAG: ASCH domain-containing protein [Prevotella sp.]|nr:ASCH domain-containing protein [Candidatus Equicola faecalis]